jgi:filamentous hemagglutinin family protein
MPQNGLVTMGQGQIIQNGSAMTVRQTTDKLGINWQSFGIGKGENVNFIQPTASAVALNRVTGVDASVIYGKLSANGQVFLINPNGVLFAPGATVNVGGLVASTLNLTDRDFAAGKYNFAGSNNCAVINQGSVSALGGYVVLAGAKVDNQGVITADKGSVALAAGKGLTVDVSGQGKINVTVDTAAVNAAAANSGIIRANGGTVLMSAKAVGGVLDTVINQTGILEAQSISNQNGVIILDGGQSGAVISTGRLDASGRSPGQTGGTVKVLGDKVALYGKAVADVSGEQGGGRVLIGGNVQGKGSEHNASQTVVGQATALYADAIKSGNGGKVVVWADDSTKFYGTISAKGGANGGSGGFVETSGKNMLSMQGNVDASAVKGQQGQWLLDPHNVEIVSGASNINADESFTVTGDDAKISADKISAALSGTDVTTTTGATGEQSGDITVSAPISWNSDQAFSLTAAGGIQINSAITNTGKGNLTLTAQSFPQDSPNAGAAVIFFA